MVSIVFFTRWSIQHEPCRRQQSIQVKPTLPELSEVKELGSNSSSEKSSQQDEDLAMDKKRFSTSSTQVGDLVCLLTQVLNLWNLNILGFTSCRRIREILVRADF